MPNEYTQKEWRIRFNAQKSLADSRQRVISHYEKQRTAWLEAIATLDSERKMNDILTEENCNLRIELMSHKKVSK